MSDVEDQMDHALVMVWQNVATSMRQSMSQINNDLRYKFRTANAKQLKERNDLDRVRREFVRWQEQNKQKLDQGFAQTLRSTVLSPAFNEKKALLPDDTILKSWCVASSISSNDFPEKHNALYLLNTEWQSRHPDQQIEKAAQNLTEDVKILSAGSSPELDETLSALKRAGITPSVTTLDPGEVESFKTVHEGHEFSVETTSHGSWNGMDRDKLEEIVLTSPTADVEDKIGFLKDHLPEALPADNRGVGDEPSSVSELERDEITDSAPQADTNVSLESSSDVFEDKSVSVLSDGSVQETSDEWTHPDPLSALSPAMEVSQAKTNGLEVSGPTPELINTITKSSKTRK